MNTAMVDNNIDDQVDVDLFECLSVEKPKSFFLFAGAGSGKTKSLVEVLKKFKDKYGRRLRIERKKVAVITYTNAACNEILYRLEYDPIFMVSTIHSFAWELIKNFTTDMKHWIGNNLKEDIEKLKEEQSRSRDLQNKTSIARAKSIQSKTSRLEMLHQITQFKYNPNGDNTTKDSLNHSEVISMAADFILEKKLMQDILVSQFPILLIDESQDTKKELIEAFFLLQKNNAGRFTLGLFGDTMQRIYADGKEKLGENLPSDWVRPAKKMNHRSNKRIITLINSIRLQVDKQKQEPRKEKPDGFVRLFICDRTSEKDVMELRINKKMAEVTGDVEWDTKDEKGNVMTLILEHHMAARRLGFLDFFEPLYSEAKFATGILDGTLSGANFFIRTILPLYEAYVSDDKFGIANIVKAHSPILHFDELKKSTEQADQLIKANLAVQSLFALWEENPDPSLLEILQNISLSGLFELPLMLSVHTKAENDQIVETTNDVDEEESSDTTMKAWAIALEAPFSQLVKYSIYISGESKFGTHQGVKGLEFNRVSVILDDEESRGFLFSYDKLFGAKDLTKTDLENQANGKETGFDRTRRLFYVACSRAKESLAIVAYTDQPKVVRENALKYGWFEKEEIIEGKSLLL